MALFGWLPQIWSNIAEILTRGSTLASNNVAWKKFKDSSFHEKETDPKFALLVQLWTPISPWKWPKLKRYNQWCGKTSVTGLSKYVRIKARPPLSFRYWACFGQGVLWHRATVECRFTQKWVRDIVITYSQIYWGLNISF